MPSTLLDARQITGRYAARTVLDAVDVHLDAGSRLGLVGPKRGGQATLLRILAGLEAPDRGTVRRLGTVGYLPQVADASEPRLSVRQLILERVGVARASRELERWAATLQTGRLEAIELHAAALERWLALGGDDLDARLARAAGALRWPVGRAVGGVRTVRRVRGSGALGPRCSPASRVGACFGP